MYIDKKQDPYKVVVMIEHGVNSSSLNSIVHLDDKHLETLLGSWLRKLTLLTVCFESDPSCKVFSTGPGSFFF